MATRIGSHQITGIGRTAVAAAVAGLAGLAVALAVASSMLFTAVGADSRALEPGYLDYGQRHRSDFLVPVVTQSSGRLDDYGLRCVATGWCNVPPGVPQPGSGSR